MRLRASTVAAATGGRVVGDDVEVTGVSIDSRQSGAGHLFVPILGERDGHDFIASAVEHGAAAYLTARPPLPGMDATAIEVGDTSAAMLHLGRLARERLPDRLVGITGSVGKTSTKDLLATVLRTTWTTTASERSFNNELGVPLTLANAGDGTEATVVEMGARGSGHIALLCEVAQPTVGVVTSISAAHLEMFGTVEGVAAAKGELVEALPADGTAVLAADDPLVAAMADRTRARVVSFGRRGGDVRADDVSLGDDLRPSFRIRSDWGDEDVTLAARGEHQVANALAAASAALVLDVPLDRVVAGLTRARLSAMRMDLVRTAQGVAVLDDAYNANPASTRSALDALARVPAERRTAVLGVMAELGPASPSLHAEVAAHARDLGIRVVSVGTPEYGIEGLDAVADPVAAVARLGPLGCGDAVLVKGSRVAGLEAVVAALTA